MKRNYLHNYSIVDGQSFGCQKDVNNNTGVCELKEQTHNPVTQRDGVSYFKNSYEASREYWSEANRQGKLTLYYIFCKLKYRNNYNPINTRLNPFNDTELNKEYFNKLKKEINIHADLTGGFIKRSQLGIVAKQIGYSENTLRINLGKLKSLGLVKKTFTGWLLVSTKKSASLLGIELEKLRIRGDTKEDLKNKHTLSYIKTTVHKQKHYKVMDEARRTIPGTLSCEVLSKRMGYRSAMTGSNRERKLEKEQRIIVSRKPLERKEKTNNGFTYYVLERPCNVLIPIKKAS